MIDGQSLNLTHERTAALKALMPDVFSEDKIDVDRLRQALGEEVFVKNEHYELSWAGKSDARREIQRQTTATLTPDRLASVDFDASDNVFIEGENLEVLRVLQRAYFGRVKMIYIDPPYNTGNDSFIYPDDYAERLTEYRQRTGKTDDDGFLNKQDLWYQNRRESGQFHSAWLSMMYPRLFAARNLLRQDGVIFVSIDDNEGNALKMLMDEIFGIENYLATLIWKRRQNVDSRSKNGASVDHEYVLCYGKSETGILRGASKDLDKYSNPDNDPRGDWMSADMTGLATKEQRPNLHYDLEDPETKIVYDCPSSGWRYEPKRMKSLMEHGEVLFPSKAGGRPRRKKFLKDLQSDFTGFSTVLDTVFNTQGTREVRMLFDDKDYFDFPKPSEYIRKLIRQGTAEDTNDIVLDFFAGSATTAQAVMELNAEDGGNRSFVLVQLPEPTDPKSEAYRAGYKTIADVSRERIRRVIQKMHREADEAARTIAALDVTIADKTAQIAEIQATTPAELFDATNPPKAIQRLTTEIDKLEKKRTETRDSHDRLVQTAKNFRAYRLSPSNFNVWQNDTTDPLLIEQLLIDFAQSDKPGAEAERMLTEFLLKTGYPLTTSVEVLDLGGVPAYSVAGGELLVLLDGYNEAINAQIWATYPKHVVCLDRLFAGHDEVLANLNLELADRDIKLTVI